VEALKHVLDKYGYWPFLFAAVVLLTVPAIVIHYATKSPTGPAGGQTATAGTPADGTAPGTGPQVKSGPGSVTPPVGSAPPVVRAPNPVLRVVQYDQTLATKVNGFRGGAIGQNPCEMVLEKVEVFETKLKWHVTYKSSAPKFDHVVWWGYSVDDRGNKLPVTAVSAGNPGEAWIPLEPGVLSRQWFETARPVPEAKRLTHHLSQYAYPTTSDSFLARIETAVP